MCTSSILDTIHPTKQTHTHAHTFKQRSNASSRVRKEALLVCDAQDWIGRLLPCCQRSC